MTLNLKELGNNNGSHFRYLDFVLPSRRSTSHSASHQRHLFNVLIKSASHLIGPDHHDIIERSFPHKKNSFLKKFQSCSKIASKLFMNVVGRLFPTFLAKNSHRDLRVSSFIISSRFQYLKQNYLFNESNAYDQCHFKMQLANVAIFVTPKSDHCLALSLSHTPRALV